MVTSILDKPIIKIVEPYGKEYCIWPDGRSEGFREPCIIYNGVLPLLQYAQGLIKKARDNGLLTAEQGADILP